MNKKYFIVVEDIVYERKNVLEIISMNCVTKEFIIDDEGFLEINKEDYNRLNVGDYIDIESNTNNINLIKKHIQEKEKSIPSEIEQLKKENEVLNDKVDNLKEALFELSLHTLKD